VSRRCTIAYSVALGGYFSLLALLLLWPTVLAPVQRLPVALLLMVSLLPLMLPLRGLLHGRPSACTWAAYLSLFYFVHGVLEVAASPEQRLLGSIEIIGSLLLFFGAVFYVRFARAG
jgi:uncharacterized membrane protein